MQVNAAAATQQMLDLFDVKGIIHFGVSGNVNDSLSIGDVVIPKQFGHTGIWDWLVYISVHSMTLVSFNLYICNLYYALENSFC